MKRLCLAACAVLLCAWPAAGDVVVDWNLLTGQAIAAGARRGPSGIFDFALVHAAIHDAIQAFEGRYEPYCAAIPNASGSPIAAAAAAAHAVLVALFPSQTGTLDAAFGASLTKYGVTGDVGVVIGQQAAACVLQRLAVDNAARATADTFVGSHEPGQWRPTSLTPAGSEVPMTAQFIATFAPFAIKDPAEFRAAEGPPHLASGAYAKAYNEVKSLGASVGSSRTKEQTNIALFFSDNAVMYWNRTLRSLVDPQSLNFGDSGRLFALVNIAVADACMTAWDSKIAWNFWRPLTAIHEAGMDGNAGTSPDTTWQPLIATPNYPDYTSGANNLSGAASTMLGNFFGSDKVEFTITSITIAAPNNVRQYSRFSDLAQDIIDARVYEGIHFRFADEVAYRQGRHIANWVFTHYLRPIGGNED